jgi:hypothetical protein
LKQLKDELLKGYNGEFVKAAVSTGIKELKISDAIWAILNNAPIKTQNDSIQGMRLAQALVKAQDSGIIEMEDGVHDWLKPLAEQVTPSIFRVNGSIVYELIKEGFIKGESPKKT